MKKADFGFLQAQTPDGKITNSSDRLNWAICLTAMLLLIAYWVIFNKAVIYELLLIIAAMAYAPKSIGKIAEMKYGVKPDPTEKTEPNP